MLSNFVLEFINISVRKKEVNFFPNKYLLQMFCDCFSKRKEIPIGLIKQFTEMQPGHK